MTRPNRCTGINARVLEVTRAATSSGSRFIVAGPNSHRVERDHERIGAVRHTDGARHAEVLRGLALEGLDVRPEDEDPRVQNLRDPLLDLRDQALVLRFYVDKRDARHAG